jgi:hypothetical protein
MAKRYYSEVSNSTTGIIEIVSRDCINSIVITPCDDDYEESSTLVNLTLQSNVELEYNYLLTKINAAALKKWWYDNNESNFSCTEYDLIPKNKHNYSIVNKYEAAIFKKYFGYFFYLKPLTKQSCLSLSLAGDNTDGLPGLDSHKMVSVFTVLI